jgi:hypothetical protein
MIQKRIALIGYSPADYFHSLGQTLEDSGFEVFWVHITRSAAENHINMYPAQSTNILDTTANFKPDLISSERCKEELAELEIVGSPLINDIILMDRILRNKSYSFALCYLSHLKCVLLEFFTKHSISLVSSGRDSALQLITMLVCKKLNIPWIVPTRARIPQEMYTFATGHETESLLDIRQPNNNDLVWAEYFLQNFSSGYQKPVLKVAVKDLFEVIKIMPRHAKLFSAIVRDSLVDKGNDYSRYTISKIILMFLRRRFNLIFFKTFKPYSSFSNRQFCLYALHTQPESSIDVAGSYFSNQIELITFISRSLPVSHELYVKIHPTDVDGKSLFFYKKIAQIPGVRLINYDIESRDLVLKASIIFTLTGTIGYEASLLGKWVITFGRNYYNKMPTVHYCGCPPKLPELINLLLNKKPPEDFKEQALIFLASLKAQSFNGEVNRMYLSKGDQLTQQDLRILQDAYSILHSLLVFARSHKITDLTKKLDDR